MQTEPIYNNGSAGSFSKRWLLLFMAVIRSSASCFISNKNPHKRRLKLRYLNLSLRNAKQHCNSIPFGGGNHISEKFECTPAPLFKYFSARRRKYWGQWWSKEPIKST